MGSFSPTVASNPTNQPMGKGGIANSATSGQPQMDDAMNARDQMMQRFPQGNTGIMNPQNMQNQYPASGGQGQMMGVQNAPQGAMGQMPQGKGQGAQGAITFPGQGGQPAMGQPNAYSNTINPSDNTGMAKNQAMGSGKGGGSAKGAR